VRAEVTKAANPGTVFMTFHYPESRTNILVGDARDEFSGCPEYKVSAVRIEKVAPDVAETFKLPRASVAGRDMPIDQRAVLTK